MENQVNATNFYNRLSHINNIWKKEIDKNSQSDTLVILRGKHDEADLANSSQPRTSSLQ
jgi:hypothetical protein